MAVKEGIGSPTSVQDFPDLQSGGGFAMGSGRGGLTKSQPVTAKVGVDVASTSRNWKDLFELPTEHGLGFYPPEKKDGVVTVKPPTEVLEEGRAKWKNCLVAQFGGRIPSFGYFLKMVNLLWGRAGEIKVRPVGENLFLIQFVNEETCCAVLEGGPWHINQAPLFVRRWVPGMKSLDFSLDRMPIWVHLKKVPLELFNVKGLSYVASAVGRPLYMDRITALKEKLEYAKVCVEVGVEEEILESFFVDTKKEKVNVYVDVPWKLAVCHHCKVFGHSDKQCTVKPKPVKKWVPVEKQRGKEVIGVSKSDEKQKAPQQLPSASGTKQLESLTASHLSHDASTGVQQSHDCSSISPEKVDLAAGIKGLGQVSSKQVKHQGEKLQVGTGGMVSPNSFQALQQEEAEIANDVDTTKEHVAGSQEEGVSSPRKPRAATLGAAESWQQLTKQDKRDKKKGKKGKGQMQTNSTPSAPRGKSVGIVIK